MPHGVPTCHGAVKSLYSLPSLAFSDQNRWFLSQAPIPLVAYRNCCKEESNRAEGSLGTCEGAPSSTTLASSRHGGVPGAASVPSVIYVPLF